MIIAAVPTAAGEMSNFPCLLTPFVYIVVIGACQFDENDALCRL